MQRPVILAGLLGAAVGVPYVVDRTQPVAPGTAPATATPAADGPAPAVPPPLVPPVLVDPQGPGSLIYASPAPLAGVPTTSLAEVLRFDVTKEWVYSRWSRKSTGLAEPGLFGVRVPLVSGTRMTDIAGSLTYYFNAQGSVEKILLSGKTADTTELVNLLVRQHGFAPQAPLVAGEQLFQVKHRGRVESELRTWPEPILWSTSPHDSFTIELELNRPGSNRYVERPLPVIDIPPVPATAATLPPAPSGTPVFPPEQVVPSAPPSPPAPATAAEPAAAPEAIDGEKRPKKVEKPVLRWPN